MRIILNKTFAQYKHKRSFSVKRTWISRLIILVAIAGVSLSAFALPAMAQSDDKLDRLVLVGPPGPMSIPLAYLVVNDKLADVAGEVELVIWENQDQLRAIVAGEEGDFVTMPSNNAAIFYNSGLDVQLLDISVWNALFGVSADPNITSLADAAGRTIAIPFQGSIPDLLYQYVTADQELDPVADFDLVYAPNPQQTAQMLIGGQVDLAILPEPLTTAAILQTKDGDAPLRRVFDMGTEWAEATGGETKATIAGTVALPGVQDKPDVVAIFSREYELAIEWMLDNPQEAGQMAEENLPELGFNAGPVSQALQNITWNYVPAADARAEIEAFFTVLTTLSPDVIGGGLPDEGFYYASSAAAELPVNLSPWAGEWVNIDSFIDDPAMLPLYEAIAAEVDGATADDAKDFMASMMAMEGFGAAEIAGNTITYQLDGEVAAVCEYGLTGIEVAPFGEYEVSWYAAELASGDEPCALYMVMTAAHQDDAEANTMLHFHFRANNESIADLVGNPAYVMWWPTMAASTVTAEQAASELSAEAGAMAEMMSMMP
jgi:NitT/TauT family transport system substrate-binding protein